ncbi:MAG: biopolymer transporter ExbD [Cellulomonas sp.]|nr:biopolymer transporter ExbD [Cellulomonas sp.]
MGMSSGGNKNSVQSEINVTPLIDVLLVLLIIFLVVMPIMMKMETLQVPRKAEIDELPDPNAVMLTVTVQVDGSIKYDDNGKEQVIQAAELLTNLRPRLEGMKLGNEKVVFVDFDPAVKWGQVISTMDSIRSLATDVNRDEIKVALKIKEDPKDESGGAAAPTPAPAPK